MQFFFSPLEAGATDFPVTKARGSHPFPSRTRSLSPSAAMILPPRCGGKVARRRDYFRPASITLAGFFVPRPLCQTWISHRFRLTFSRRRANLGVVEFRLSWLSGLALSVGIAVGGMRSRGDVSSPNLSEALRSTLTKPWPAGAWTRASSCAPGAAAYADTEPITLADGDLTTHFAHRVG